MIGVIKNKFVPASVKIVKPLRFNSKSFIAVIISLLIICKSFFIMVLFF